MNIFAMVFSERLEYYIVTLNNIHNIKYMKSDILYYDMDTRKYLFKSEKNIIRFEMNIEEERLLNECFNKTGNLTIAYALTKL